MGLVCPVCRFVFRAPKNHPGQGMVCPACQYLLNFPSETSSQAPASRNRRSPDEAGVLIPTPRGIDSETQNKPIRARQITDGDRAEGENISPPKAASGPPVAMTAAQAQEASAPRVRRKKHTSLKEEFQWDSDAKPTSGSSSSNSSTVILIASLAGVSLLVLGALVVYQSLKEPAKTTMGPSVPELPFETPTHSPVELTDKEKKTQKEIQDSVKTGMNVMKESEDVVRRFFNAKSPEELLKFVRNPALAGPRMKQWYAQHGWSMPEVKEVGYGGRITVKGRMASLTVQLNDFSLKQIALERIGDDYKVDWESWVAWTSHPWAKLFEDKPQKDVIIRALCAADTYYNRSFSDDKKWLAVRMTYNEEHRSLYGYVDRNDPDMTRFIADVSAGRPAAVTLKIRYPENPTADNQVIISEYLHSGWVEKNDGSSTPESQPEQ